MWNPEIYQQAWEYASLKHQGQTYGSPFKGKRVPYNTHIGSVAHEIIHAHFHSPIPNINLSLQCALLHDVVEDTNTSIDEIEKLFGKEVANGVLALTKNESLDSKELQMKDSLERILQQPKEIWCVKLADRICNLYAPPHYWKLEKRIKYQEEAQTILNSLKGAHPFLEKRLIEKINTYQDFF